MAIYSEFANLYDSSMDNIPYDRWTERICELMQGKVSEGDLVCELGCGTGELTLRLAKKGYDMIGIDLSDDMLNVARDKMYESFQLDIDDPETFSNPPILFLEQDMREFELYGTVRAIISVCDSLNYLSDVQELTKVFRLVNNYLDKDGVFIFDVKTEHFYKNTCGNQTRMVESEDGTLIWENTYDEEDKVNYYNLTMFHKEYDGRYRKSTEEHVQKVFAREEIVNALKDAGMNLCYIFNGYSSQEAGEQSVDRLVFVATEGFQEGKLY